MFDNCSITIGKPWCMAVPGSSPGDMTDRGIATGDTITTTGTAGNDTALAYCPSLSCGQGRAVVSPMNHRLPPGFPMHNPSGNRAADQVGSCTTRRGKAFAVRLAVIAARDA